jgi:uncharacterized RDD family membrane protein YckC
MTLVHERTSQFFEGVRRRRREIVTPEGAAIPVELADYGERLSAFFLDFVLQLVAIIVMVVLVVAVASKADSASGLTARIGIALVLFIYFLIRNMYFIFFEIAWRGATPGKRAVGLRVIDRHGGPLLPTAVIARNLTREVEMFLPLGILMTGGAGNWEELSLAVWMLFFAALPAINRDRMRGGDLIAGTTVIALPKRTLSSDLVEGTVQFSFTEQQLRAYGAFELQVLEELLRRPDSAEGMRVLNDVCDKICHKIVWTAPVPPHQVTLFLRDFYTAERAFLEREQLYGKGRADKYAQAQAKK